MSSDDGVIINRKNLKAYHYQGEGEGSLIAEAKTLDELIDKVNEWIDEEEYYPEYGIRFLNQ